MSSSAQSGSGSSLKRSCGSSSSHCSTFATRVETTKRSGCCGSSDRLGERESGLLEREVERGGLERPAPVLALACLQERKGVERVAAGERQLAAPCLELALGSRVVVDLLAAPLETAPAEHDDRAPQGEVRGHLLLEGLEAVAVDLERQVLDGVVGRHAYEPSDSCSVARAVLAGLTTVRRTLLHACQRLAQ